MRKHTEFKTLSLLSPSHVTEADLLNALRQHGKDHGASLRTSGASITEVEVRHG